MRTREEVKAEIKRLKDELAIIESGGEPWQEGAVKIGPMATYKNHHGRDGKKLHVYGLSFYSRHFNKWNGRPYQESYVTVAMSENRDDLFRYLKELASDMKAMCETLDNKRKEKGETNGTESK